MSDLCFKGADCKFALKNKKKDLLKNQRFVLVEAYLNSHSLG